MEDKKTELLIVSDLPQVQTRKVEVEGKEYECMTTNEAIQEILLLLREIKRGM